MEKFITKWKTLKRANEITTISLKEWLVNRMVSDVLFQSIEPIFYPIKIKNDLIQFTNYFLNNNGSGDDFYLVVVNAKYMFFKLGFEADCDGSYYYGHLVNLSDVLQYIDDFTINYCYTSQLLKSLENI